MNSTLKVTYNGEVRRTLLKESDGPVAFERLQDIVKNLFAASLKNKPFDICWKDEDDDEVVVSSDNELGAAVYTMTNHLTGYLKFYVREKAAEEGDEVDPSSSDPIGNFAADESIPAVPTTKAVHNVGSVVTCDECGMSPIVGIRYKCAVREDYDLCEKCERSKLQPYPMVKIVNPDQAPQALVYVFADHQAAGAPGPAPTEGPFWQRGMRPGYHSFGGPFGGPPRGPPHHPHGPHGPPHHGHPHGPHHGPHGMFGPPPPFGPPRGPSPHHPMGCGPFPGPPGPPPHEVPTATATPCPQPCGRFQQRCERKAERLQKKLEKVQTRLTQVSQHVTPQVTPWLQAVDNVMTSLMGGNTHSNTRATTATSTPTATAVSTSDSNLTMTAEQEEDDRLLAQALEASLSVFDINTHPTAPVSVPEIVPDNSDVMSRSTANATVSSATASVSTVGGYMNTASPAIASLPKPALRFVKDVTFPNDTSVRPGAHFVKLWRVRNDGAYPWPLGAVLVSAGGDDLLPAGLAPAALQVALPTVLPDQETDVAVELVAPARPGRYTAYFRAQTKDGQNFGHRLWATIVVIDPEEEEQVQVEAGNEADWQHVLCEEEGNSVSSDTSVTTTATTGTAVSTPVVVVVNAQEEALAAAQLLDSMSTTSTATVGTVPVTPVVTPEPVTVAAVAPATPAPVTNAAVAPPVVADPEAVALQSRALLWRRELAILADMGFVETAVVLPLLVAHLQHPVSLQSDKHAVPDVEGLQRVVTALLTTQYQ